MPDASIEEAFGRLPHHHGKVLPVADESTRLVGIVSQTDLIPALLAEATGHGEPNRPEPWLARGARSGASAGRAMRVGFPP